MKSHAWISPLSRKIMYAYCGRCGLILLNNKTSQKAAKQSCTGREDD